MFNFIQSNLNNFFLPMKLAALLENLCSPTWGNLKQNRAQQNLILQRNKAYCAALCSDFVFLFLACFIATELPRYTVLITLSCVASKIVVLLLTCRKYPKIFPLYFALAANLYITLLSTAEGGCFLAFAGCFAMPVSVLVLDGSWFFSLITTGNSIYIYFHNLRPLLTELMMNNPQASINSLIVATIIFIVFLVHVVGISNYMWLKSNEHVCEAGKLEYAYNQQNNFLLGLSHELRNPLNAMMGNIQLALLEGINPKVKEYLEQAQIGGEILLHFINNILDSGKASIGKLEVNFDNECNIYCLCEQIWSISRRIISHKGLNGLLKVNEKVPKFLKIDSYRLIQMMLNLIGNSVKFTNKGRVNVEIDWIENSTQITTSCFEPIPYDDIDEGLFEKHQTSLSYMEDESPSVLTLKDGHFQNKLNIERDSPTSTRGILKITVTDTGCGIPPESLDQVFAKFAQVNNEVTKRNIGSGLGLFITKEITDIMKGEIRAFSKLGKGTTFIVCIPCLSSHPPEPNPERINDLPTPTFRTIRKGLKILVVDDMAWNNEVMASYTHKIGGTPVISLNGADAFEKYQTAHREGQPYDAVTMDYDMPIMNGYEALKKIRKYEQENNLNPCVAIVVSGHCDHNIISECLDPNGDVRANYFLKKPITYKQFLEVLSKV